MRAPRAPPTLRAEATLTAPALEIVGLSRRYRGGRTALDRVDLSLARGRTLGLAGPNGSGKSTLLSIVAGTEVATAGSVRVLGGSPLDRAVLRRVGWLPEDSPFPRELSARAALELCGALQGLTSAQLRERCGPMLEAVGLAPHARTRLGRYSRGMLRRFGLAQAALHDPELLLLDEPTAGLDAEGFEALDRLLERARARGASVVLASHLAGDLELRCDELCVLVDGRVAARGTPAEVLGRSSLLEIYRAGARTR